MKYPAIIYPSTEGGFVAEVVALPGCLAQGETLEECISELEFVTELWISANPSKDYSFINSDYAIEKLKLFNQSISVHQ